MSQTDELVPSSYAHLHRHAAPRQIWAHFHQQVRALRREVLEFIQDHEEHFQEDGGATNAAFLRGVSRDQSFFHDDFDEITPPVDRDEWARMVEERDRRMQEGDPLTVIEEQCFEEQRAAVELYVRTHDDIETLRDTIVELARYYEELEELEVDFEGQAEDGHYTPPEVKRVFRLVDSIHDFANSSGETSGETICQFCQETVDVKQNHACLNCGHVYHDECIENWIKSGPGGKRCPVCRTEINEVEKITWGVKRTLRSKKENDKGDIGNTNTPAAER